MTRTEFNRYFAARMDNTEGFTAAQIAALNDQVFEAVENVDAADRYAFDTVEAAMGVASCSYSVVQAEGA
jgi:hypothetical protein